MGYFLVVGKLALAEEAVGHQKQSPKKRTSHRHMPGEITGGARNGFFLFLLDYVGLLVE